MAGEEKTEKATPKKRQDARKEGQVLQSKEIVTAATVLGTFFVLSMVGKFMLTQLMSFMEKSVVGIGTNAEITDSFMMGLARDIILVFALTVGPIMIATGVFAILSTIVQTRGLFSMKALKPKFSHINPLEGAKRLFSLQTIVSVLKGVIELIAIGYIVYIKIIEKMPEIARLFNAEPIQGMGYLGASVMDIVMTICVVFAFIAAADYLYQWWNFEKKLKMSKKEVKDEYKQMEGDPQIKQKIKQRQQQMAQARMMQEVPKADVVIRNPTHFAVAIKYEPKKDSAPVVVAKGADQLALRIVKVAEDNDVYVTEDKPLARLLYDTVDLGHFIPKELYIAIAEILTVVYNIKKKEL